jgi:hypothetical protein
MKELTNLEISKLAASLLSSVDINKLQDSNFISKGDTFIIIAQQLNNNGSVDKEKGTGLVDYGYCVGYTTSEIKDYISMRYVSFQFYPPKPIVIVVSPIDVVLGKQRCGDKIFNFINIHTFINLISQTNPEVNKFIKFSDDKINNPNTITL